MSPTRMLATTLLLAAACAARTGAPAPPAEPALPLEGPTWTLIELGGSPVAAAPDGRRPYLQLLAAERRVQGFGGCNRLSGSYETTGAALRFPLLAMTRMACQDTMQLEQAFVVTLEAADHFRIEGDVLELIAGGETRARLRGAAD